MLFTDIYDSVCEEFGSVVALGVCQVYTIDSITKLKKKQLGVISKRQKVIKKARKVLWELNDDDFNLIIHVWEKFEELIEEEESSTITFLKSQGHWL